MEIPELIDIIYEQVLDKYREKIEKEDSSILMIDVDNEKAALQQQLTDEQNKLLNRYTHAIENKLEYIHFQLNSLILNIGIKYGMQLQKEFDNV